MMGSEQNKEVVRRFIEEGLNHGDLDSVADVFDPSYTNYMLGEPMDLAGAKQALAQFQAAFPDMQETIEEMVAEGEWVAVRETFAGTHQGEFNGIAPTGKRVAVQAQTFFRVRAGKIVEDRPLVDMLAMMQQLGAIPSAGQG
jgi:steroid delta-isomerase-like uncharacterized protein